jgi:hypothetical protein
MWNFSCCAIFRWFSPPPGLGLATTNVSVSVALLLNAQDTFPFGIVSLAGGTSEGFAENMGALRYAQSLNAGVLPTKDIPNTFVAQAYDAGDPCSGGGQCCVNKKDGMGGWPCLAGIAPFILRAGSAHDYG